MRRAARVDANQAEIVLALRQIGATICDLHRVGQGCCDLLVGFQGRNVLLEIKTAHGRLTEDEDTFLAMWRGEAHIVQSADEALHAIGAIEGAET